MHIRKYTRFGIRSVLLVMLVGAIVAARYQPREISASLEPTMSKDGTQQLIRITNTSRNSIWVYGYATSSPFYDIELRVDGQWNKVAIGRCGTGAGLCELKRNASSEFTVSRNDARADAIRVAVTCFASKDYEGESRIITSSVIELPVVDLPSVGRLSGDLLTDLLTGDLDE